MVSKGRRGRLMFSLERVVKFLKLCAPKLLSWSTKELTRWSWNHQRQQFLKRQSISATFRRATISTTWRITWATSRTSSIQKRVEFLDNIPCISTKNKGLETAWVSFKLSQISLAIARIRNTRRKLGLRARPRRSRRSRSGVRRSTLRKTMGLWQSRDEAQLLFHLSLQI